MEKKLVPIEHNGVRVITTELLAQIYETDTNNIKVNFNRNKGKFREGVHYFLLQGDSLRAFKREVTQSNLVAPNVNQLYLWTERGANRHCKILDTPKAWEQFDNLEETYFMVKEREKGAIGKQAVHTDITRRSLADAEARLNNSRARLAAEWRKIAGIVSIPEYRDVCASYASMALAGREVLPLPAVSEKTYSAEEIGVLLGGLSPNKIGRIANQNHLKTPEYGIEVWDKSPYSSKQVSTWRYNDRAVRRFREILDIRDQDTTQEAR